MTRNAADLIDQLGAPDHGQRTEARSALLGIGGDATPALVAGLQHQNWRVRSYSAELLNQCADPSCAAPLARALNDPIAEVRRNALRALIGDACGPASRDVDVVGLVIDRAYDDRSIQVRRRAVTALAGLRAADPRIEAALEDLCHDADALLGKRARWALHRRRGPRYGFSCPHCGEQVDWGQCRQALRDRPHCFSCLTPLQARGGQLHCPGCGREWENAKYRKALKRRSRLPCPNCSEWIRKSAARAGRRRL